MLLIVRWCVIRIIAITEGDTMCTYTSFSFKLFMNMFSGRNVSSLPVIYLKFIQNIKRKKLKLLLCLNCNQDLYNIQKCMLFHIIYDLFTVNTKGKDFNRCLLGPISYCVLINSGIKDYSCRQLNLVSI